MKKRAQTIPKAIKQLSESLTSLRDSINTEPVHEKLYRSKHWKQICACLDVLEDTTLAITSFQKKPEISKIKVNANAYLHLYGLLQALFVQQDAVFNLGEALDPSWNKKYADPETFFKKNHHIERTRRIRNISIGHPTKRKSGKEYGFIRRASIFKHSFDIETLRSNGTGTRETFFINEAIYDQLTWAANIIESLEREVEHEVDRS